MRARPARRGCAGALLALLSAAWSAAAPELAHDLYLCVTLEKAFYIGSRTEGSSGIFRSPDRQDLTHVGVNHPRISAIAVDPASPGMLFAAATNGLLRTTDDGRSWRILTGWDMTELKSVAPDPHAAGNLYVALPDGIGVSRDAGLTWTRGEKGIRRKYTQVVAVDRTRAGWLIAATEKGIYRSEDGAATWTLAQAVAATVNDVKQSPHDPRVFLAATQSDGAWRSADGGRTWRPLPGVGATQTLHRIDFDPSNPRRIVLCGWGCGVLVSEDEGATFQPRNAGLPNTNVMSVACDPDLPGRLYAAPHQSAVYRSDDFGRSWRKTWFESATVWSFAFVPRAVPKKGER